MMSFFLPLPVQGPVTQSFCGALETKDVVYLGPSTISTRPNLEQLSTNIFKTKYVGHLV